jgi:hypothetical protein
LRSPTYRALFWTAILVELIFFAVDGKPYYYPAPIYPVLYAAGAVWVVRSVTSRPIRVAWVTVTAAFTLLLLPLELPVLPAAAFARSNLWETATNFAEMYGWPGFTEQVGAVYRSLPQGEQSQAMILASNYGEAGALDLYGARDGVPPNRVVSPHLTYYYWAPPRMDPQIVVTVGYTRGQISNVFGSCRTATTIRMVYGIRNQEAGAPILICRKPRRPLWQSWLSLQSLD